MIKRTVSLILLLGLAAPFPAALAQQTKKAKKKVAHSATPTPSPAPSSTPVMDDEVPAVTPSPAGTHKGFTWYFKNGCNCPQCRVFRQQQQDAEDRRKNLFQP